MSSDSAASSNPCISGYGNSYESDISISSNPYIRNNFINKKCNVAINSESILTIDDLNNTANIDINVNYTSPATGKVFARRHNPSRPPHSQPSTKLFATTTASSKQQPGQIPISSGQPQRLPRPVRQTEYLNIEAAIQTASNTQSNIIEIFGLSAITGNITNL